MECLDEETILAFGAGKLADAPRALAEEHIGTCDECRQLVSAVVRSSFVDPEEREDLPRGPLLLPRVDMAMAPTTPVGGAGGPRPSVSPVEPGQILAGKFEVERVLGAGGMGIVVAARHTQLEQRVALKFLLPVACEVPGAVARFLREGKAAARITSEHVARVMDTGVLEGGAPYLVMEYLEGADLGAVVQRRGRVSADEAIEYVLQACEAIVEAHDLGIVHRDLKPANLFLSKRADGSPLVKVLDFGISKVAGSGSRSQLTSASVLMGSPRYMSPEQMLSAKDVDARTDVWALGVILYELVTGKPVWHADTVQGLCALIASAPAPSLLDAAPDAPTVLADVVASCLAKAVDTRIASVADLALALEPIAPASARTSIDRILRVARKERGTSTGPISGPRPAAAADVTTHDARRGSSGSLGVVLAVAVAVLLVAGIAVNAAISKRDARAPADVAASGEPVVDRAAPSSSTAPPAAATSTTATTVNAPSAPATAAETGSTAPGVAPSSPASAPRRPSRPVTVIATSPAMTTAPAASAVAAPPIAVAPAHAASSQPAASASNRALTDRK